MDPTETRTRGCFSCEIDGRFHEEYVGGVASLPVDGSVEIDPREPNGPVCASCRGAIDARYAALQAWLCPLCGVRLSPDADHLGIGSCDTCTKLAGKPVRYRLPPREVIRQRVVAQCASCELFAGALEDSGYQVVRVPVAGTVATNADGDVECENCRDERLRVAERVVRGLCPMCGSKGGPGRDGYLRCPDTNCGGHHGFVDRRLRLVPEGAT